MFAAIVPYRKAGPYTVGGINGFAALNAVDGVDGQAPGSVSVPARGSSGFGSLFDTIKSYLGTDYGKLLLLAAAAGGIFLAEKRGWFGSLE